MSLLDHGHAGHSHDHKVHMTPELFKKQKKALIIVLFVHLITLGVEISGGYFSRSTTLFADAIDLLGHVFIVGMSLLAANQNEKWAARLALVKGSIMLVLGLLIFWDVFRKVRGDILPEAHLMGLVGAFAFLGNLISVYILIKFRNDDINMRSSWICSVNDLLSNISIMIASVGVAITQTIYPDTIVSTVMSIIILISSLKIIQESLRAIIR